MRFNPFIERPDAYYEGGGELGGILKGALDVVTLGMGSKLLGDLEADMPDMPSQPDSIQTGQQVAQKAGGTFDENAESKANARKTARKGTSQFRIPLANTTTGVKAGGGTGLKI